jgi:hypothetical protein
MRTGDGLHPFGFEVAKRAHLRGEDLGDFRDYLASRAGLPRAIRLDWPDR